MQPADHSTPFNLATRSLDQLAASALFNATSDAVYLIDANRTILSWNQSAAFFYGWDRDAIIGQQADLMLYPTDDVTFQEAFEQVHAHKYWMGEQQHVTRDGQMVLVLSRWTMIEGVLELPFILVVNSDMTEQKALESHVIRSQRIESLGTMASGIAHDMNNLLGPLKMSVDMLSAGVDEEKNEQILSFLQKATQKGMDMMDHMLSYANGATSIPSEVDVSVLAQDGIEMVQGTINADVKWDIATEKDLWTVTGDATQILQVIVNVCMNAGESISEEGVVRVRIRNVDQKESPTSLYGEVKSQPYVMISVTDNGIGLDEQVKRHMFDPFFSTKENGSGLGLSTVIGILKGHQGFVDVDSDEGLGTTVRIYLPASPARDHTDISRVLVVENDPFFRRSFSLLLDELGYDVLEAGSEEEAYAILAVSPPDLLICDWKLDQQDGLVFLQAVKSDPELQHLPCVLMTGNVNALEQVEFTPDYCLPKPFGVEEVVLMLDALAEGQLVV